MAGTRKESKGKMCTAQASIMPRLKKKSNRRLSGLSRNAFTNNVAKERRSARGSVWGSGKATNTTADDSATRAKPESHFPCRLGIWSALDGARMSEAVLRARISAIR